jgi:hypothetical protein
MASMPGGRSRTTTLPAPTVFHAPDPGILPDRHRRGQIETPEPLDGVHRVLGGEDHDQRAEQGVVADPKGGAVEHDAVEFDGNVIAEADQGTVVAEDGGSTRTPVPTSPRSLARREAYRSPSFSPVELKRRVSRRARVRLQTSPGSLTS